MTGFARCEESGPFGSLTWELRTVNHRYLEIGCRLPEELRGAESEFRHTIATALRRGKVDCTLNLRSAAATAGDIRINRPLAEQLIARAKEIGALVGATGANVDPLDVLRWPGVVQESERDLAPLMAAAHAALSVGLKQLGENREREGARIHDLLEQRCITLLTLVEAVNARLPEVRARLRARVEEKLAQLQAPLDATRLEQELVLMAQKMDVDEELERLKGHVAEIRQALAGHEPAGRRLDFLMQELNREANTLSSKSQDLDTTRAAVDMKVTIEQMREQVQNVE